MLALVRKEGEEPEAMGDEEPVRVRHRHNRTGDPSDSDYSPQRRQSAWSDPRTWMTLFGLMLTICALLLTATIWVASRMLDEIGKVNTNITTLTLNTSNSFTQYGIEIKQLAKEQDEERAYRRDQIDYNFNVNKCLTEMATTLRERGLPVPNVPQPPKGGR